MVINRTKQWLSQRVRLSASKKKQKESTLGVAQSRGYRGYAQKMRSFSRQNMSTDPDEGDKPQERIKDLLKKLQEKMKESELLKKAVDFGVTNGLGVVPLAKVLPPMTSIGKTVREGSQEKEEEI